MVGNTERKTDTVKVFLIIKYTDKKKEKDLAYICLNSTNVHKTGTVCQEFSEA